MYGPAIASPARRLLLVGGLISALGGAVLALAQDDLKRLLAYDTISQMGVLAVGLAAGSASGLAGTTYHLISHALFKGLLFLCAGAIVHMTGDTDLSRWAAWPGASRCSRPHSRSVSPAIAGVPPFSGYPSLALIHDATMTTDPAAYAVELVAQVVTIAALARAAYLAFYRRRRQAYEQFDRLHPGMTVALWVLGGASLVLGGYPTGSCATSQAQRV